MMKVEYVSWLGAGAVLFSEQAHRTHLAERLAITQTEESIYLEAYARGLQEQEQLAHFPCTSNSH